jgi:hypothetical protein
LTGLQELLGTSFTRAIGLISAVSGGSVGIMYYLDRFGSHGYPENEELKNTFISATQDSLDATGWGLAYPDLWRVIALPLFPSIFTKHISDRGIALETDWQGEMKGWEKDIKQSKLKKSLATWREQIFKGEIPIPIFNATLVETGCRFLITPMTFGWSDEQKFYDFNSLYSDYDINVVTAARLSATFPYVSPICRGRNSRVVKPDYPSYHVADGGYFDNSGFVTALEWLNEWLAPERELNIKRVLLLQIDPFPLNTPANSTSTKQIKEENRGWLMATLGPLLTIFKVRDPILNARNLTEVEIFTQKIRQEVQIDIQYYQISFPSLEDAPEFYSQEGEYRPPLSWKLTQKEKDAIKRGWNEIASKGKQIQQLKKLWRDDWKMGDQ